MTKTTKKNARRYYAEWCPYGVGIYDRDNTLMVFYTREERDAKVKELNEYWRNEAWRMGYVKDVCRAITRKEASKNYRTQDLNGEGKREVYADRTCCDRCYFEVGNKRAGKLH